MLARTHVRLTIKINSENNLYPHSYFTKHLVDMFEKSPRKSNSNNSHNQKPQGGRVARLNLGSAGAEELTWAELVVERLRTQIRRGKSQQQNLQSKGQSLTRWDAGIGEVYSGRQKPKAWPGSGDTSAGTESVATRLQDWRTMKGPSLEWAGEIAELGCAQVKNIRPTVGNRKCNHRHGTDKIWPPA
jgi:hypothetical protein